jgi:hypothetical protein
MGFRDRRLTAPSELESSFQLLGLGLPYVPTVGVYDEGLFTVLDSDTARHLLRSWEWLVGAKRVALLTTALGDVLYWSGTEATWLNVQRGTVESIEADLIWVLDSFLEDARVIEHVLVKPRVDDLIHRLGPLTYHQCYILKPWLILGGVDRPENYDVGHCGVYIDLVGQTLTQLAKQ